MEFNINDFFFFLCIFRIFYIVHVEHIHYFYNWGFKKIKGILRFALCIDRVREKGTCVCTNIHTESG